jgi:GntR family transcriptional regulator
VLNINPADATPIWKQIDDELRRLVAAGQLPAGEYVPSVRDLAKQLRINPATVARAYQSLVDAGILVIKRGEGTLVADTLPALKKSERGRLVRDGATKYAATAITAGAELEEAQAELEAAYRRLTKTSGGNGR